MSTDNFNKPENTQNEEELTSILKRLSEILDKSVSLDEAVAMVKEQKSTADTDKGNTTTSKKKTSADNGQLTFDIEETTTVSTETTDVEETIAEETVAEEAVAEEIVAEEAVAEETVAEETVAEETVAEEAVAEEIVAEETVAEETVAEETVAEEAVAEETVTEEIVAEEAVAEETVAEETVAEEEDAEADELIKKIMFAIQTAPAETTVEVSEQPDIQPSLPEFEEEVASAETEEPSAVNQEELNDSATCDNAAVEPSNETENNSAPLADNEQTYVPEESEEVLSEEEPGQAPSSSSQDTEEVSEVPENSPVTPDDVMQAPSEETLTAEADKETDATAEESEEIATPKIFDELLACFDGHKLPDDFRFSEYNAEEIPVPEEEKDTSDTSEEAAEYIESGETAEEETAADKTEEKEEEEATEEEPSFTPIDHEIPQDDDELFSKIFSEEKTERKNRENDKKKWQKQNDGVSPILTNLFDWVEVIVLSAAFALLLFTFVFRLAVVEGDSMMNTLYDEELLVISDLMYTPEQGDIIVFTSHGHTEPLVKRVIATEGQTVDIDFDTWTVTVDGVPLEEKYINRVAGSMNHKDVTFPLTVTEGHIFVMGDNRNNSKDSRDSSIGLVDTRNILGEVKIRLFPFDRFGKVD